jgi:hypothetical protein
MGLYIIVEGSKILSYGKQGDIEISSWPQKNGQPAKKSECYWDGTQVLLKANQELLDEYKKEQFKQLADHIKENWIKSARTPNEIRIKVREKNVTFNSKAEVDAAIQEIKDYLS